jgi:hypothetical protein
MSWRRYGLVGAPYYAPMVSMGDGALHERTYFKTEVWKVRLSPDKNPAKNLHHLMRSHNMSNGFPESEICRFKEYIEKSDHPYLS